MMTAERWYEYQNEYQKYGIDMRPASTVEKRQRGTAVSAVSARDKKALFLLLLAIGIICIALIILSAYTAGVTYDINRMLAEEEAIQNEIANMTVELKTATSIQTIEERAAVELGMVYAPIHEIAYVGGEEIKDFSVALRTRAYN